MLIFRLTCHYSFLDQVTISQGGIVGITCGIFIVLFGMQSFGTQGVSFLFSPVVAYWFASIAGVGIYNMTLYGTTIWQVVHALLFLMPVTLHLPLPQIPLEPLTQGLSPHWIVIFFINHGSAAWKMLGAVMLCITGTEALFADLGHFSVPSISIGFGCIVYPCVMLAYLGQVMILQFKQPHNSVAR